MNWKQGLLRIYIVVWALFAILCTFIITNRGGVDWVTWAFVALGGPAVALAITIWIIHGFKAKPPTQRTN